VWLVLLLLLLLLVCVVRGVALVGSNKKLNKHKQVEGWHGIGTGGGRGCSLGWVYCIIYISKRSQIASLHRRRSLIAQFEIKLSRCDATTIYTIRYSDMCVRHSEFGSFVEAQSCGIIV
jgi:hypothetical protein